MEKVPKISKDLSRVFSKLKIDSDAIVELDNQRYGKSPNFQGGINESELLPSVHLSPAPLYLRPPVRSTGGMPSSVKHSSHKNILAK